MARVGGQIETAALGMNHAAGEVCFAHVLEKRHPTGVQCVDEDEGAVDRERLAVRQLGPGILVVRLDGGPILSECHS